jgi:hypothetical protein
LVTQHCRPLRRAQWLMEPFCRAFLSKSQLLRADSRRITRLSCSRQAILCLPLPGLPRPNRTHQKQPVRRAAVRQRRGLRRPAGARCLPRGPLAGSTNPARPLGDHGPIPALEGRPRVCNSRPQTEINRLRPAAAEEGRGSSWLVLRAELAAGGRGVAGRRGTPKPHG